MTAAPLVARIVGKVEPREVDSGARARLRETAGGLPMILSEVASGPLQDDEGGSGGGGRLIGCAEAGIDHVAEPFPATQVEGCGFGLMKLDGVFAIAPGTESWNSAVTTRDCVCE